MTAKEALIELATDRKDWTACNRPALFYLNICYYLAKHGHVKIQNVDDASILYDNLVINNEIIDADTITEYDPKVIEKITRKKYATIKQDIKKGYVYLLNFYSNKNARSNWELQQCSLKLFADYNELHQLDGIIKQF